MTLRVTFLRRYRFANTSCSWGKPPSLLASPLGEDRTGSPMTNDQ
ncbi:MAG: hypothetical protein RMY33_005350 [Nostoc sp. DedQUE03]|nr:hypothetical protein [Nostoc sp. DedQUE02]